MTGELPPEAYAAALAGFQKMSVRRLAAVLRNVEPSHAFAMAAGHEPAVGVIAKLLSQADVRESWRASAASRSPELVWQQCADHNLTVLLHGRAGYPSQFVNDPMPPALVFVRGDLAVLADRRVGMVGTRNATAAGRDAATRIARGLGEAGVHVVSGLARGIDGCAHRGLLSANGPGRPIGVVASGLDVVYPREHRQLWHEVAERGLLLSESPPGTAPEPHRFPLRNRLVAALSELIVVVESRERGGSLLTVDAAIERGVAVMAVPGGVHNRAATGCNNLLRDGAAPVVDASDVLLALSLDHHRAGIVLEDQRPRPRAADLAVYRACADEPRTIDSIVLAVGASLVDAAMSLARLEQSGWLAGVDGWYELSGSPLR